MGKIFCVNNDVQRLLPFVQDKHEGKPRLVNSNIVYIYCLRLSERWHVLVAATHRLFYSFPFIIDSF